MYENYRPRKRSPFAWLRRRRRRRSNDGIPPRTDTARSKSQRKREIIKQKLHPWVCACLRVLWYSIFIVHVRLFDVQNVLLLLVVVVDDNATATTDDSIKIHWIVGGRWHIFKQQTKHNNNNHHLTSHIETCVPMVLSVHSQYIGCMCSGQPGTRDNIKNKNRLIICVCVRVLCVGLSLE